MSSRNGGRTRTSRRPGAALVGVGLGALLAASPPVSALPATDPVVPAATTWSPATQIDASPGLAESCRRFALVATGPTTLLAVTSDAPTQAGQKAAVRVTRSTDGGQTWSVGRRLSATTRASGSASLATDGRLVHAVWISNLPTPRREAGRTAVMVATNTAGGAASAWRPAVRLTSRTGRVATPSIAASGSWVHVAVTLAPGDGHQGRILLLTSKDKGRTWTRRVIGTVSRTLEAQRASRPIVAATGRRVVVVWTARTRTTTGRPFMAVARTSRNHASALAAPRVLGDARRATADALGARIVVAGYGSAFTGNWVRIWQDRRWSARRLVPGSPVQVIPVLRGAHQLGVATASYGIPDTTGWPVIAWTQSSDDGRTWSAAEPVSTEGQLVSDLCAARWTTTAQVHVLSQMIATGSTTAQVLLNSRT